MVDRVRWLADDEGIRGSRRKVREALLAAGFESLDLELICPGADIYWVTERGKRVGVQSKTLLDFISSCHERRLHRQLYTMVQHCDIPVLLVEGIPRYNPETGGIRTIYGEPTANGKVVKWEEYTHSYFDLQYQAPCRFGTVFSPGLEYTVRWLLELGPRHFNASTFDSWEQQEMPARSNNAAIRLLLSWDGVGEQRAIELLREYKTPIEVLYHLLNGGWKVRGIGKGTQESVLRQLHSEYRE